MSTLQTINVKHPSSASNNVVLDNSGNTTVSGALTVSGNATITGTLQANGVSGTIYPLTLMTAQASTSGTFIDFTGIPSWVRRITVMFNGVSTNSTSNMLVQLGTSGGIETTGYTATSVGWNGTGGGGNATATTGILIRSGDAAVSMLGHVMLTLVSGNTWVSSHTLSTQSFAVCTWGGGNKTLAGTLTQLRITTVGGTDVFDAGSINVLYE